MAHMNPHAAAFWDLAYTPSRSDAQKRPIAEELWTGGGHELGFYASVIAYKSVTHAQGLLNGQFVPPDLTPEQVAVVWPEEPDRARQAATAAWDLLWKTAIAENTNVLDPFIGDERVQIFDDYGALAVFWMAYWVYVSLMVLGSAEDEDLFADFVDDMELFLASLPEVPPTV